jgi:flagellar basal-body rod modification protein FlgD
MVSNVTSGSSSGSSSRGQMNVDDFIQMMVTQLQNQDPLEPADNNQLLSQMSQIGQLQSSQQLQTSLQSMVIQNNIASAGNMIGKEVSGFDEYGEEADGQVTAVRVEQGQIMLELDNGKRMNIENVTSVSAPSGTPVALA